MIFLSGMLDCSCLLVCVFICVGKLNLLNCVGGWCVKLILRIGISVWGLLIFIVVNVISCVLCSVIILFLVLLEVLLVLVCSVMMLCSSL